MKPQEFIFPQILIVIRHKCCTGNGKRLTVFNLIWSSVRGFCIYLANRIWLKSDISAMGDAELHISLNEI